MVLKKTIAACLLLQILASSLLYADAGIQDGSTVKSGVYGASDFNVFLDRHKGMRGLKQETLCTTEQGRPVELLRIDARAHGMYRLLLTARHDAGDTAGSYVLEGMLDAFMGLGDDGKWIRERTEIAAVPFVDKDGVDDGVTGTDYSSDYSETSTLAAVEAIRKFMKPRGEYMPMIVIDLHASATESNPRGEVLIAGQDGVDGKHIIRFTELLKGQSNVFDCAMVADESRGRAGFSDWVVQLPSIRFVARVDIPSGTEPEAARAFGRNMVSALRKDLEGNQAAFLDLYSKRADLRYKLFLPIGYQENPDRKWPLILWLHGGGPYYGYESVISLGVPRYVLDTPDFPFITLTPLVPTVRWEACTEALNILLDETIADFRVDAQRIYMTGQSLGGCGTWEMAMKHPEKFAAVAPASGAGCFPGLENMKGIPVWAIQGDDDVPAARPYQQATVDAFRQVGGEVKFPQMPGVGHDVYREAYMKPDLYDWFLQYTNPGLKPVPPNLDDLELVTMEPMRVAFAESKESDTWAAVEQFAADNNLLGKPGTRFLCLNWRSGGRAVTVGPDVEGNESFTIKEVFGDRYVVQNIAATLDPGPGPMGVYREEARAYRWLSLHGKKFPGSGTIHEYSGSPLKRIKMYVPIVEHAKNNQKEDNE